MFYNEETNNYLTTCETCHEVAEYKTAKFAKHNTKKCLLCRKYPEIVKINDRWSIPCPRCQCQRTLETRAGALQAKRLKAICHSCANRLNYESQPNNLEKQLAAKDVFASVDGKFVISCPTCKTERAFSLPYLAWKYLQNIKSCCRGCLLKNRDAVLNLDVQYNEPEIWKTIEERPNYSVSNYGRVKNVTTERILKGCINNPIGGYIQYILGFNKGKPYIFYAHRLVARAFIPNPENKPQVNHRNLKRDDNRAFNLEWVTQAENNRHAKLLGSWLPEIKLSNN